MRLRTAFPAFQAIGAIGTFAGAQLGLRQWLSEKREHRARARWQRECERAIRKNGISAMIEPGFNELGQVPRHRAD